MFCLDCGLSQPVDDSRYCKEITIWRVWGEAHRAFKAGFAEAGLQHLLGIGGLADVSKTYFYDSFVGVIPAGLLRDTLIKLTNKHIKVTRYPEGRVLAEDHVLVVPVQRVPGYIVGFIILNAEYEAYIQIRAESGNIFINMNTGRVLLRLDKDRHCFKRARQQAVKPEAPSLYIPWDPTVDRIADLLPEKMPVLTG
jgi:hypothetical protein